MLPGAVVLSKVGTPTLSDFNNATGAPIVGDTSTGILYWLGAGQNPFAITIPNILGFGSLGTGDDYQEIQASITYLAPYGGWLLVPIGTFPISAGLVVTSPIRLMGFGNYSAINPTASVNILTFRPNSSYAADQTLVSAVFLGNPATGTHSGINGIYLDTQITGAYLPKFTVRDSFIAQGSGYAIRHDNTIANNPNGGLYSAMFENNELRGGIFLGNSGDSIVIRDNIISGSNKVYISLTNGASLCVIEDNNITTQAGAIVIDEGSRFQILNNNIEQTVSGGSANGAMIDINGANGTMYGGNIEGNLLGATTGTGITKMIRLRNTNGLSVKDNVFVSGIASETAIEVGSTCVNTRIYAQTYNANISTKVDDSGIGTCGVVKPITLLNSWVNYGSAFAAPTFYKSTDGIVHVSGLIKNGTATPGTQLFVLPVGFRPAKIGFHQVTSIGGGGYELGSVQSYDTGEVTIEDGANTLFSIEFSFVAANLADGVSAE